MRGETRLVMIDGGLPPPVLQYEIVDPNAPPGARLCWPTSVAAEYDALTAAGRRHLSGTVDVLPHCRIWGDVVAIGG